LWEITNHDGIKFDIYNGRSKVFNFVLNVLFGKDDDEKECAAYECVPVIVKIVLLCG